jgi:DNA ligase-1
MGSNPIPLTIYFMIKTYPTLYAKDSTEATRVWWCEQVGHEYYMCSGVKGGAIVSSAPTVCKGKNIGRANETTPIEQATAEIEALYKKKKKLKYFEDEADINEENYFQPMLAKGYEDYKDKVKFPVYVQCKYNGGRVIAKKEGLFTRKGEKYWTLQHIHEELKDFFKKFPNVVLDGEGFNEELRQRLNDIMSLMRKSVNATEEDHQKSRELIKYYVYDVIDPSWPAGYRERAEFIHQHLRGYKYIVPVPSWECNSGAMIDHHYRKLVAQGHEGVIVRILGQPYEQKRSKNLLKYKPVDDAEGKIIAIHEGSGNWAGMAKTITIQRLDGKLYDDGTDVFDAQFKGTQEEAKQMLKDAAKYISKICTYTFFGFTGKGKPNYGQFDYNCWDNAKK